MWISQLLGFAVTALLGTLLHFLYEWTGGARWAAIISGVNESTFEHMKLLFWPMLVFALFQWYFHSERGDFWCVKLRGMLLGLALIPVLFYTYNGVIGKSPDFVNIAIFFVAAAAAYIYESILFKRESLRLCSPAVSLILIVVIALAFVIFTFRTPRLNIFFDPLTATYGIPPR